MTSTGSRSSRASSSPASRPSTWSRLAVDVSLDGRFVWPIVLVALGAAGLATAVRANAREEQRVRRGAGRSRRGSADSPRLIRGRPAATTIPSGHLARRDRARLRRSCPRSPTRGRARATRHAAGSTPASTSSRPPPGAAPSTSSSRIASRAATSSAGTGGASRRPCGRRCARPRRTWRDDLVAVAAAAARALAQLRRGLGGDVVEQRPRGDAAGRPGGRARAGSAARRRSTAGDVRRPEVGGRRAGARSTTRSWSGSGSVLRRRAARPRRSGRRTPAAPRSPPRRRRATAPSATSRATRRPMAKVRVEPTSRWMSTAVMATTVPDGDPPTGTALDGWRTCAWERSYAGGP